MKAALVSPEEKVYSYDGSLLGERIAEVTSNKFEVASPLFWVDCSDDVLADQWYWTGDSCQPVPLPSPPPVQAPPNVA